MYASLLTLNLGPGMRLAGEKLADQFATVLKTLKGFKGVTHLTVGLWAMLVQSFVIQGSNSTQP